MGDQRPTISAVVNTRNAARYLDYVLRGLSPWVDQIVVADMASTDETVAIAKKHGAVIVDLPELGFAEAGIPAALAAASGEWIIRVDADEVVTRPLAERLVEIAHGDLADVVYLPCRTWIVGEPLNYGSFGPENCLVPRFFRAGQLTHTIATHGKHHPVAGARVLRLTDDPAWRQKHWHLEHFSYVGVTDLVNRAVRYTKNETDQTSSAQLVRRFWRSVLYVPVELAGRMVHKKAWRDGKTALMMAANSAIYSAVRAMHLAQRRWFQDDASIQKLYEDVANDVLSRWEQRS